MNESKTPAGGTIGIIFARPKPEEEIRPKSWESQMDFISDIAKSANALLCIYGEDGSGKTTFLRQLSDHSSAVVDFLNVTPATPSLVPGWLSLGLMQWLTSEPSGTSHLPLKLAALAENTRPILVSIDAGDFIHPDQLADECCALLNLADASGLRLSILVCCSPTKSRALAGENQIATRLIYNKPLSAMTTSELTEIGSARLKKANATNQLDANAISKIAQTADGSPTKMIRALCQRIGLEVPPLQSKIGTEPKTSVTRKAKKSSEAPILSIDDLLAPPSK